MLDQGEAMATNGEYPDKKIIYFYLKREVLFVLDQRTAPSSKLVSLVKYFMWQNSMYKGGEYRSVCVVQEGKMQNQMGAFF